MGCGDGVEDGGWGMGVDGGLWMGPSVIGPLWGTGCNPMKQSLIVIQKKDLHFLVRTSTCSLI